MFATCLSIALKTIGTVHQINAEGFHGNIFSVEILKGYKKLPLGCEEMGRDYLTSFFLRKDALFIGNLYKYL